MKPRLLLVEDDQRIVSALLEVLEDYEVSVAATGEEGVALATKDDFDVVLTDFRLPGLSGLQLVQHLRDTKPRLPILLMTAHGTSETAIEATKSGAYDYLLKPFEMQDLLHLLEKAVASRRMAAIPVSLGEVPEGESIVGRSRAIQEVFKEIGRIVVRDITVLIRGETGTGKELIARALYQHGNRADRPFIAVNCAAIPDTLLESELFGHEKGAFTGADARRIGRFEQAHGGTLFLDEIGDLAFSTQAKLLRVLQERTVQRVGGKEPIPIDVRLITATHCDLETAIAEKRFREDLFYRLNVATILVPPLRKRAEDIPHLVGYFLKHYAAQFGFESASITSEAMEFLTAQTWPGNVRELQNVIRKALLASRGYPVGLEEVRQAHQTPRPAEGDGQVPFGGLISELLEKAQTGTAENVYDAVIEAVEKELFTQSLAMAGGNQAKAARWLGLARRTLREKLQRFGIHPSQGANGD